MKTKGIQWAKVIRRLEGETQLCKDQMYKGDAGCLIGALAMNPTTREHADNPESVCEARYNLTRSQVSTLINLNDGVFGKKSKSKRLAAVLATLKNKAFRKLLKDHSTYELYGNEIKGFLNTGVLEAE